MNIDIVTLFPNMFTGVLNESMLAIAREKGIASIQLVNLRDFTLDKHRKVDAPPYGGGAGMVIMAEPVVRAVEHLDRKDSTVVLLTPAGKRYDQATARELAARPGLILLCGHYEGFDERVRELLHPMEISVGDYVLTGGEIAAMAIVDSVVRLLPGVLGSPDSLKEESFSSEGVEYPHYTRPAEFRGLCVPEVLRSGDHKKIAEWRRASARKRTEELLKRSLP
jgi:tRNA (guanine37-N1)-methyltransferase